MKILIIFLIAAIFFNKCLGDYYTLKIEQGLLRGTDKQNYKGGIFYSFQKIPFGRPPVGELRFKEPQKADGWDDILDATKDLPQCVQESGGTEDCLYLNVYTPQVPSENYDELLDVMVWIYGGGFRENSGSEDLYSPEFLLTKDIVLVTINYRLGLLASFNLEDPTLGYQGNLGMKDQTLALKWVQSNIAKFGGNPGSVTIFGESAGGCAVHHHVLSPLSAGTFHKAIIESGTAISPWTIGIPNNGVWAAEILNIPTDNATIMINELLAKTSDEIFTADLTIRSASNGWASVGYPTFEKEIDGQDNFLTTDPRSTIRSGIYNHIPILVGYNNAEGISYISRNSELHRFIPWDLEIEEGSIEEAELLEEMRKFYYGDNEPSIEDKETIIQLFTDVWFMYPAYRLAKEHIKTMQNPLYFYRFSADTLLNVYKLRNVNLTGYEGATHCDELGYLFKTYYHDTIIPNIEEGSVEDKAIDRIVTLWTNFAKYGTPTPSSFDDFQLNSVTEEAFNYLDFGSEESRASIDPDPEHIKFWADVYDKYYPLNKDSI